VNLVGSTLSAQLALRKYVLGATTNTTTLRWTKVCVYVDHVYFKAVEVQLFRLVPPFLRVGGHVDLVES
jgi:hypothetical protein